MKVLVLISLVGGLMLSSCGGSSSKNNANVKEVNPADTIYLGDLREKFADDSIFFKVVAPDLMFMDYQYLCDERCERKTYTGFPDIAGK